MRFFPKPKYDHLQRTHTMKKYSILVAALLAIVAVSACQKKEAPKPAADAAPAADTMKKEEPKKEEMKKEEKKK